MSGRTIYLDQQFVSVTDNGDDLVIGAEGDVFQISGDLSAFLERVADMVRLIEEGEETDAEPVVDNMAGREAEALDTYLGLSRLQRTELTHAVLERGHIFPYSSARWTGNYESPRPGARWVHAITTGRLSDAGLIEWDRFGYIPSEWGRKVIEVGEEVKAR